MIRQLISYGLLALLLATLTACQRDSGPKAAPTAAPAVPVTTARSRELPMNKVLPVLGTLFAKDEAALAAEVEGKVEKTFVEFGDRVKEGQVLAQIDTSTYEAQLQQSEAALARAAAAATNAESNLKRIQALSRDKVASASDLDQAQAARDESLAGLQSAQAQLAIARLNLEKSKLRAPFDAAVAERLAGAGDFVKTGSVMFRIVNDRVLKFIVQAPERHASQVVKEQLIQFTVDAWPGEVFSGKVYLISPAVNTGTRAFSLGALVPNPDGRLKANTFARGELILQRDVPTVLVPLESVVLSSGSTRVFVLEKGVARARTVEVGRVVRGEQEVIAGVRPGETVITTGQSRLVDGTPVRVRDDNAPAGEPHGAAPATNAPAKKD